LKIETNKEVCIAKIIQEAFRRPYDEVAAVKRNGRLRGYLDFGGRHKVKYFWSKKKKYGNSMEFIENDSF